MPPSDDESFRPAMDAQRKQQSEQKQRGALNASFNRAKETAEEAKKLKGNTAHTLEKKDEPRKGYLPRGMSPAGNTQTRAKNPQEQSQQQEKSLGQNPKKNFTREAVKDKDRADAYRKKLEQQQEQKKELSKNPKKSFTRAR